MTDPALAARVEAWIDSAGHTADEVTRTARAVLDAGFDLAGVRDRGRRDRPRGHVRDDASRPNRSASPCCLRSAEALNDRLAETAAEFLFVVRWGIVVGDLLPKAVGFLDRFPTIDLTYGDSVTAGGMPLLRPLFSPIRLRSNDYLGPVLVVRTGVVRALGGFRPEARRAQVLDLALRAHAAGRTVALDPQVLATEDLAPGDFAGTSDAQTAVVASHLAERGIAASVEVVEPFVRRVRYEIVDEPLVSVDHPHARRQRPHRGHRARARRRGRSAGSWSGRRTGTSSSSWSPTRRRPTTS